MELTDRDVLDIVGCDPDDADESLRQALIDHNAQIVDLKAQAGERDLRITALAAQVEGWASELEDALRLLPQDQRFIRECVSCGQHTLVPRISADGSAWEGWTCAACGRKEWFTVPLPGAWLRTVMEDLRDVM